MIKFNTAVLIIDDEEMVRENMREILLPRKNSAQYDEINAAANILFDAPQPLLTARTSSLPNFTVDIATNGMEGVERVKKSIENKQPYAVIFLDMRMPGMDGLETAKEIRKFDNQAEIIFVTAYSDRSIEEIVEEAGQNVGYHCKPYASEEITQLATKAVNDYNRLRNLEKIIKAIASIGLSKPQLSSLLTNILEQLAAFIDTDSALLGKLNDDNIYEEIASIGTVEEDINIKELIHRLEGAQLSAEEVVQVDELVLVKMVDYYVFAILKNKGFIKTEKMYLIKLFVQNAAHAIRNAELSEQLLQKEKLSAAGKAIGMVVHDLRSPIKNLKLIITMMRDEGDQSEWVNLLEQCADQASEIFDDFLDFIKDAPVKKLPVNVGSLISEVIKLIKTPVENISIQQNIPADLIINGDQSKLKRVILNLANNATDAFKQFNTAFPEISITAQMLAATHQIEITVRDNGPGIPASIIKTLFEPFVTQDKQGGTGLGLAIVKQYVQAHGGTISVSNNNGAVFTIILPLY